jgi:nitrogen fixation NifU-like protein
MNIYQEIILDHYRHPHNFGDMDKPDKETSVVNTVCGDKIAMKVRIERDVIYEIKFSGQGCAISMASASLLTDYARGKSADDLRKLSRSDILKLLSVDLTPNRLKCALLPLEALHKLLNE